ncbi:fungal specific transcription factor domain-containing protein [Diaporthe helianthi]|uniref:Fungal specific transcription factor domain-containing protein n=1 Tax=Diaporthe helianthi TaxID=158607 RepID=A0A2P5HSI8_DIAHE|nr:fungal specific transcription factor domain-containing protein [Diaporthe helianthi]
MLEKDDCIPSAPRTTAASDSATKMDHNSRQLFMATPPVSSTPHSQRRSPSYARGRAPSVVAGDTDNQAAVVSRRAVHKSAKSATLAQEPVSEPISLRASPEPTQTDQQGHYVGPASGVSFLLRVQRRVYQTLKFPPSSSIFTFGDAPLPDFDLSFFVLPPKDVTRQLLVRYFDFAVPTHRFLHRPTVEAWFEDLYTSTGCMSNRDEAPARTALLFMVFAQASLYMTEPATDSHHDTMADISSRYFLAAEHQLQKERGQVRLASVQARLAQCFWLLSQSRINHCWTLFGTTAHLALAIGLNRGKKTEAQGRPLAGSIETECRRRTFWCAYTLDKYLAAALGRPRTFHEDDIDQELPSCIDDSDLERAAADPKPSSGQPLMLGAVAHIRLSRINDGILKDLYPIWPLSTSTRLKVAAQYSTRLRNWYTEMAEFLDSSRINTSMLLPIYQRQRHVLNLAYWHATILTQRPFLLNKFGATRTSANTTQVEDRVKDCLQAALNICDLVDELISARMMFKAFWFTSYYAFCAAVVLYVFSIQQKSNITEAPDRHLAVAIRCQEQMSMIAEEHSLARRYCLVLDELRKEAIRHSERSVDEQAMVVIDHVQSQQFGNLGPQDAVLGEAAAGLGHHPLTSDVSDIKGFDASPGSSLYDMSGWGTFDSMASKQAAA